MAYILRKVERTWWYRDRRDQFQWLMEGELHADILCAEMATVNGTLSVYCLDAEKTHLERIVAAIACTRNYLQNLDYVLIPEVDLREVFRFEVTPGETPDSLVNELHRDIVHLTPSLVNNLTYRIRDRRESICRCKRNKVKKTILQEIDNGHININQLKEPLRTSISK